MLPAPRRPEPRDRRARQALEWAEVCNYIFWLVLVATTVVVTLIRYGPDAMRLLGH
jgi:hypothetical protein